METTNNIKLTFTGKFKDGRQYQANISLNNEHKNGYEDFSITGYIWKANEPKTERNLITSGAIGNKLKELNESFNLINNLHLCDFNGAPMHATSNMHYHIKNGKFSNGKKENFKKDFCKYYRITGNQFNILNKSYDYEHFIALFFSLPEIKNNWKIEAQTAIKWLEEQTNKKFVSKSTRSNLTIPDNIDITKIKESINNGYYDEKTVSIRVKKEKIKAKKDKIQTLKDDLNKKINKLKKETEIKIVLIKMFGTCDNVIYYTHKERIVFNWMDSTHHKEWDSKEVEFFKSKKLFNIPIELK